MAFLKNVLFDTQTMKLIEMVYDLDNNLIEGTEFIQAEVVLNESYTTSASVTNYPVEQGAQLGEHASRESFRISMSGVISDASMSYADTFDSLLGSPIGAIGARFVGSNTRTKSQKAFDKLQEWMAKATPVIVKSHYAKDGFKSLGLDENAPFVIESLTVPRDKSTGQSIRFELSLRQVIIVTIGSAEVIAGILDKGAQTLMANNKANTADQKNKAQKRTLTELR